MSAKTRGKKVVKGAIKAAAIAMLATPMVAFAGKSPPPPPPPPSPPPPPPTPSPVKVNGMQFFSWFQTAGDANYPVSMYPSGANTGTYLGVPFLTDANASTVSGYLQGLPAGSIRAVKVMSPIANTTANLIFNNTNYNVSYVFGDLEMGSGTQAGVTNLVKQVKYANQSSGTLSKSGNAFIGNFGFTTQSSNSQAPTYYAANFSNKHSYSNYQYNQWTAAGLNMSNEEVYPGSPSMRSKGGGDSPQGSGSYSNLRGQLFVLPLWRVGQARDSIMERGLTNVQQIPYTANFNNFGNPALDNDRNPNNGFLFEEGKPMLSGTVDGHFYPAMTAAQTTNQMLSRKDNATMSLHMRLRGADSFHLLDSGIVDNPNTVDDESVSRSQMESDFATGWLGEAGVNAIFAKSDRRLLIGTEPVPTGYASQGNYSGGSDIWVDGAKQNVDQTGAIFSGAYSLSLGKLDVLISNMDDASHKITLPATIGGYALSVKDFTLAAGSHMIVEYTLTGSSKNKGWSTALQHVPFTAINNSRHGFGIPEPGTLSLLAVAGVFGLNRRKRQAQ